MIPALNEERTIPYALVSLAVQTVTPDRIVVVDDGSTDDTARITTELDDILDVPIDLWQHDEPMGKTVGVKEVARSVETDTVFVLDADTFLESEDYLERLLAPHIESDVASSFGVAYPTETSSKRKFHEEFSRWVLPPTSVTRLHVETDLEESESRSGPIDYLRSKAPVVQYRNVSYHVEQRFFGDGFYRVFDSALFPVGCGVLYDREKLVTVFDDYEESLGDDLTNSEDIFIGFAFSDRGWTNVHVDDTYMRSEIPGLKGTFKQNYLWGSGFLQSAYYFKNLTTRYRAHRVDPTGADGESTAKLDAAGDRSETGDISGAGPSESASSATDVDLESESSSTRGGTVRSSGRIGSSARTRPPGSTIGRGSESRRVEVSKCDINRDRPPRGRRCDRQTTARSRGDGPTDRRALSDDHPRLPRPLELRRDRPRDRRLSRAVGAKPVHGPGDRDALEARALCPQLRAVSGDSDADAARAHVHVRPSRDGRRHRQPKLAQMIEPAQRPHYCFVSVRLET